MPHSIWFKRRLHSLSQAACQTPSETKGCAQSGSCGVSNASDLNSKVAQELHKKKNHDGEKNCQIMSNYVKFVIIDSQRSQNFTKMPFGTWIKSC